MYNKSTYAALKYLYGKDDVLLATMYERFGPRFNSLLVRELMRRELILVMKSPTAPLLPAEWDKLSEHTEYAVYLTFAGEALVEDHKNSFVKWVLPLLVSALALAVSAITAAINLLR